MAAFAEPVVVKRYAGERLYQPSVGAYLSLGDLAVMVENDEDFVVIEATTGDDITRTVLKQIIVERGNHG